MGFLSDEKRKNDEPRRFQWWLLVIGFVLGILLSLVMMQSRSSGVTVYTVDSDRTLEDIQMTATAIIAGATGTAGANGSQLSDEALYMTATQIIIEATQQAASTPAS